MAIFPYEVFLTVVESESFTKTGEKLGLSQSGVSHNISTLEKELGIQLLWRNRNGISLTDAGERVIPHIRQMIHHFNLLNQEAALIQGIEVGSINIGTFPSFSASYLPKLIRTFKHQYPGIHIELSEGGYDEIKKGIISGQVDLGFLTLPFQELETIPLVKDELFVLVHSNHPLYDQRQISIEMIHHEPFIMPKAGCEALIKRVMKQNNVQPNVIFEMEDNNTIIAMVQEGLGISIIPDMILPKTMSNINAIPLEKSLYREIGMAVKSIKQASPSIKKFITLTKESFQ